MPQIGGAEVRTEDKPTVYDGADAETSADCDQNDVFIAPSGSVVHFAQGGGIGIFLQPDRQIDRQALSHLVAQRDIVPGEVDRAVYDARDRVEVARRSQPNSGHWQYGLVQQKLNTVRDPVAHSRRTIRNPGRHVIFCEGTALLVDEHESNFCPPDIDPDCQSLCHMRYRHRLYYVRFRSTAPAI